MSENRHCSTARAAGRLARASLVLVMLAALLAPHHAAAAPQAAAPVFGSMATAVASSNLADGVSVAQPSGTASGDFLLALIAVDGGSETIGAPDGWTQLSHANTGQASNNATVGVFWKVATGSEPATYNFTWSDQQGVGAILRYTGVDPSNPIDVWGAQNGSSNSCTAPSVSTTVADSLVMRLCGAAGGFSPMIPPSGSAERADIESGTSSSDSATLGAADVAQATTGATGSGSFNLEGTSSTPWRALTVVLRPASTQSLPPLCVAKLDFETDDDELPLQTGQIIDDEWSAWGIAVSTNDPVNHPAMIFDSAAPTGGDPDLGTPNEDFGGPGIGAGGGAGQPGENSLALGKLLIISEDANSGNPDDNAGGGVITFNYAADVYVDSLEILDIEETAPASIRVFDAGNTLLKQVSIQTLGDNSYQTLLVDQAGVRRMEVALAGSGGVPSVTQSLPLLGCLGDYVWHDDNRDQNEDYGIETGLAGVRVRLLKVIGNTLTLFRIATTDSNGFYLFDKLEAGTYVVDVNEFDLLPYFPTGFLLTTANEPYTYTLAAGEQHREADFGYDDLEGEVALGDWVWYDVNSNGQQDDGGPDDVGIPCVTIELLDSAGTAIDLTNTDSWGIYHFYGLPTGAYSTRVYVQDADIDAFITWKTAGAPDPTCVLGELPPVAPRANITTPAQKSTNLPNPGDYDWTLDYGFTDSPLAVALASFAAQAQEDSVLVTWESVSELNNAGFNLYRGADAAPETLLAFVASAAPGASYGASYEWTDSDVQPGQTYRYWLEDVGVNGATTLHGPVSVTYGAPTAVTLDAFEAVSSAPATGWVLVLLASVMAAAGWLGRRLVR